MDKNELRELVASVQHEIWSHWMKYMFTQGEIVSDTDDCGELVDVWVMPNDKFERWVRQMNTPYAELTENERESDRHQADKIISIIAQYL